LPSGFPSMFHGASSQRIAGRLIQPDPADPTAVAVSLHRVRHAPSYMLVKPGLEVCFMLVVNRATGAGCDPYQRSSSAARLSSAPRCSSPATSTPMSTVSRAMRSRRYACSSATAASRRSPCVTTRLSSSCPARATRSALSPTTQAGR
jgi:hypothetical protein